MNIDQRQYINNERCIGYSEQIRICASEEEKNNNVQAFIMNLSALTSVEELLFCEEEFDGRLDIDIAIDDNTSEDENLWTAPRWAKIGDIIFFAYGKRAIAKISATKTELRSLNDSLPPDLYKKIDSLIERERAFHKKYGGTIFAVGRIAGAPETHDYASEDVYDATHFKSRFFAQVELKHVFENPIHVDDCSEFLQIVMTSSITPVNGDVFDKLRNKISESNSIPSFLKKANATPLPLSGLNDDNWMTLSNEYRRSFMYEMQFRHYYVDRLLKGISDIKTIYSECQCKKPDIGISYIDNVILMNKMYLPVEVKLSIKLEHDIKAQVRKYCHDDYIVLNKNKQADMNKVYKDKVLIVDTYSVYYYDFSRDLIEEIVSLDDLKNNDDIASLRKEILKLI